MVIFELMDDLNLAFLFVWIIGYHNLYMYVSHVLW